jgi:hypothetical protein
VTGNKAFTKIFGRDKLRDSYRSPTTVRGITMGRSCTADGNDKKCTYRKTVWNGKAPVEKTNQYDKTGKTIKETA